MSQQEILSLKNLIRFHLSFQFWKLPFRFLGFLFFFFLHTETQARDGFKTLLISRCVLSSPALSLESFMSWSCIDISASIFLLLRNQLV
jgi:hypothetical protein